MAKEVFQLDVQINTTPALAGLRGLNKELDSTRKKVEAVGKGNKLGGVTTSVNGLSSAFKGLGGVLAGIGLGAIATQAVTSIANFERLRVVLETVTGSATGAVNALKLIQGVSATTPFSVDQLGESFIKLQAAGITPTAEKLNLFADVASVTTDKVGALQAITDLYARTTAGGLGLEELNRLADRGIPVFDILSKRIGVSRLQLSELGKTADGAAIIIRQLEAGLSAQFGGAASKQLNTLSGQFEILKKNITNLFTGAGGDQTSGLTKGLTDLLKVLNEVVVSSDGTAKSVGETLGSALRGLASTIGFVSRNWEILLTIFLSGFIALRVGITGIVAGFNVLKNSVVAIGGFLKNLKFTFEEMALGGTVAERVAYGFQSLVAASKGLKPIAAIFSGIGSALTSLNAIFAKVLTQFGANILYATGLFSLIDKARNLYNDIVGNEPARDPRRDFRNQENNDNQQIRDADRASIEAQRIKDKALASDLATGRQTSLNKILASITQEISLIGKSTEQVEKQNAVFEFQDAIRQKLITAGKDQATIDAELAKTAGDADKIRSAIAQKFAAQRAFQFQEFVKNTNFEISLIGLSNNEIEKQTKLREFLIAQGRLEVATEAEKLKILEQITRAQNARINDSLQKNLDGINKEVELLKLSNKEREIRIALDQAAADAGFKNAEELQKRQPQRAGEIRSAVINRQQTGIDVEGQKQIDILKEQISLNGILDDKERERERTVRELYRTIDPDGKGENITRAQKGQIAALLETIKAQEELIAINEKINDQFTSLGDAVTKAILGGTDAVKQLKLELLKLAALQLFKTFAGGNASTGIGSFITGVIGGISGARASGGPVDAGKSYLVGEFGPEIIKPSRSGYVIPNNKISSVTGASITVAPNLIIQGSITGQSELDRAFEEFAGALAAETQKLMIKQTGQNGILRGR